MKGTLTKVILTNESCPKEFSHHHANFKSYNSKYFVNPQCLTRDWLESIHIVTFLSFLVFSIILIFYIRWFNKVSKSDKTWVKSFQKNCLMSDL